MARPIKPGGPTRSRPGQGPVRTGPVRVEGFAEFRRELKKLERDNPKELNDLNFRVVDEIVIPAAKARARREGRAFVRAADTLRAARQASRAAIKLGSAKVPDALGWEFGSKQYRQFEPWRGNQHEIWGADGPGYFMYPGIRDTTDELIDAYWEWLGELVADAFPD